MSLQLVWQFVCASQTTPPDSWRRGILVLLNPQSLQNHLLQPGFKDPALGAMHLHWDALAEEEIGD